MSDTVLCDIRDKVALLTLNRPEKLNALNYELIDRLMALLDTIERDDDVRVVILTGAGDRAFSSGADIAGFAPTVRQGQEAALRDFVRRGQRMTARIETFPKPVIVAVNGIAHGGGSEITEAAPLAIASERAEFCKAEIRLGFAPPFGGSQRLARLIGRKRALRMILTAEPISAMTARDFGLVNDVVPHERLLDEAFALAAKIIPMSPLAVTACLGSVTRGINVPIDEGLAIEASWFARMVPTHDIEEGISAFLEKRRPHFTGT
jgi:enoyl-CoA hydratase